MSASVRPLDHAVVAGRDLARLGDVYSRLGFTVGAENRHPWGTHNRIVQFADTFIELISMAPGVSPAGEGTFGRFIGDYLARGEGCAMLALRSSDGEADAAAFAASSIGDERPFRFERLARGPEGEERPVGFTLAFAASKLMPRIGFFTCAQHHPQNFWMPPLQIHANGARGMRGIVMVAADPADHAEFLSAFTGQREMLATSMGLEIPLPGGQSLAVLTPEAARFRYGEALPSSAGTPQIAALRLVSGELEQTRSVLEAAALPHERRDQALVVPHSAAGGVALAFEPA